MVLLFLGLSICVYSQKISVENFFLSENDLTAQGRETTVLDQNGDKCALIRIQTKKKGFVFDVGSAGVQYVDDNKVGEIWVYVPYGVRHISIRHPEYESLVNYNFPINIQKARTYIMSLAIKESSVANADIPTSQYLVFKLSPATATIIVNDEVWETNNGSARKYVSMGTYSYRVIAPNHKAESGVVVLDNPNEKKVVDVKLKSEIVNVEFTVADEAEIWIDGEKKGNGRYTAQLGNGKYLIEARMPGHKTTQKEIAIDYEVGDQSIELSAPQPIYGKINIATTPDFSSIFIDGNRVGETPLVLQNILIGPHELVIKKDGYVSIEDTVFVQEGIMLTYERNLKQNDTAEVMPTFPGGISGLMGYLSTHIIYPVDAEESGIQGRVICTFIVEKDGTISDPQVIKPIDPSLDKEAIRVIQAMPPWTPGMENGVPVRVKYTLPITFRLK